MTKKHHDKRKYLRHPTDIPVEITDSKVDPDNNRRNLEDVSIEGLSFSCDKNLVVGGIVKFMIPVVDPVFEAEGRVAWCRKSKDGFSVGVEFLGINDAFRGRMVEQVCYIEHYRRELSRERGVEVSSDEAAVDWIKKYASSFPQL